MKYIEKNELPEEIKNNYLPIEDGAKPEMKYNQKIRTSGGFVDAMFLSAAIIVCLLWSMIAIFVKGWFYE